MIIVKVNENFTLLAMNDLVSLQRQLEQAEDNLRSCKGSYDASSRQSEDLMTQTEQLKHSIQDVSRLLMLRPTELISEVEINSRVHEKANDGSTPLHWAACAGRSQTVQVLLEMAANPNQQDERGMTALHWACSANRMVHLPYGHDVTGGTRTKVVHYLLHHGANPSIQDADGNSALHFAADMGDSDTVEQLLDHRADAGIPNRFGCTAAHYAMQHGSLEIGDATLNPMKQQLIVEVWQPWL